MSVNEILIVIAIILILVDFFLTTDIPTHISYIIICFTIARNLPFHILYKIMFGIIFWFIAVSFHYILWRKIIQKIVNNIIAKDKFKIGPDALIGQKGMIKNIENNLMLSISGDLWSFISDESENITEDSCVIVNGVKDGKLVVNKIG